MFKNLEERVNMPSKPKSKNIKKITPKAHHNEFPNTSEKNILKSPRE